MYAMREDTYQGDMHVQVSGMYNIMQLDGGNKTHMDKEYWIDEMVLKQHWAQDKLQLSHLLTVSQHMQYIWSMYLQLNVEYHLSGHLWSSILVTHQRYILSV